MQNHKIAAGLLMCRIHHGELQFFLAHPGGPFYKNKETGVWSIPKGLPEHEENLLTTAIREFNEETGLTSSEPYTALGSIKQKGGKVVHCWAFVGQWDPSEGINCNHFSMEWPPHSGQMQDFPEQDKAAWMNYEEAAAHIIPEQITFLDKAKVIFM